MRVRVRSIYYCPYGMILANLHYLPNGFSLKVPSAFRYTVERVANTFADCTGEIFNLLTRIVDALTQNWIPHISQHNYHTLKTVRVGVCVGVCVSFVCICRPRKRCWFARNWHKTAGDRSFLYSVCQLCVRALSFLSCSLTHLREHHYGD